MSLGSEPLTMPGIHGSRASSWVFQDSSSSALCVACRVVRPVFVIQRWKAVAICYERCFQSCLQPAVDVLLGPTGSPISLENMIVDSEYPARFKSMIPQRRVQRSVSLVP